MVLEKRAQASLEFLILLSAILIIVGSIVYSIYFASTGLGTSVENEIENTTQQVENLLKLVVPPIIP